VEREFPSGASEMLDPVTRRNFVKLMASSFALAGIGLTGCRRAVEHIVPFTRMPEDYTHGVVQYYATAMPTRIAAVPLLVKSHEGRPIKIEGNADHPDSNGGTNAWTQASILNLYDVDRAQRFTRGGQAIARQDALNYLGQVSKKFEGNKGAGLCFLSEPGLSPSRLRLQNFVASKFPEARWFLYEPIGEDVHERAATLAFGQPARPYFRFDKAAVILSLDCDFIGAEEDNQRYISGFSKGRKIEKPSDKLNRLYVVEALMTLTGMNADHRLRTAGSAIPGKVAELANAILNNKPSQDKWINECAQDLLANKGKALVVAGHRQPLSVHLLAHAINNALGAVGQTVLLQEVKKRTEGTIEDLANLLNQGKVETLVITGGNPVYTAPADLNWAATQRKAKEVIRLGYYEDETFKVSDLHLPEAHYLESWGDARSSDGTIVAIQPLIEPLFGGITELELIARISGASLVNPHDIVKDTFKAFVGTAATDNDWKQFLHDGFIKGSAVEPLKAQFNNSVVGQALNEARSATPGAENLEVVFYRDYSVDDGRYNNNGWLLEMPDPVTKVSWDSLLLISEQTAKNLGLSLKEFMYASGEHMTQKDNPRGVPVGRVTLNGKEVVGPIWIQPGLADNVVALALGYGRTATGRVGFGVGYNAYNLRTSKAPHYALGGKLAKTTEFAKVSCVQHHWSMEGRTAVREANYEQYQAIPKFAKALDVEEPPVVESLYPNPLDKAKNDPRVVHQWGMTIDLNSCVSCQACVIACQSENNIPIVGKDQVYRQREMHWLRLDRYYTGSDTANPQVVYQPMLCQHCEAAPCENVCPVNATTHDEEGLNLMVYNRCVGTRYCSNNCPYKVRRFNFFDYNRRPLKDLKGPFYSTPLTRKTDGEWDMVKWFNNTDRSWKDEEEWELLKLVKNPDVTVRMRGVMEKCTFCIQRIESAKIAQKVKAGASDNVAVPDGTIKTACQQACPADAIVFGNIKDPNSRVSKMKALDRNYQVLDFLFTRPRITYLAKVRNPNPKMPDYHEYPLSTQEYRDKMHVEGNPYKAAEKGHGNPAEHVTHPGKPANRVSEHGNPAAEAGKGAH
jgi:molybdopterin-containing oxidoreductase family iron-sulfur binding subunit